MEKVFEHKPRLGVFHIFEGAQKTSHEKLMKELFRIFTNSSKSFFITEFLQCLGICMIHLDRIPSVEKTLDFAAKYCIYHSSLVNEDEDVLMLGVFGFIFENHCRKLPAIRFRTCEFINRLLNKMGPHATLHDDIYIKIADTMLERLKDRLPSVRAQAVMALQRLQEPPNKNCPIIKAFIFHMETDPSCEVRARLVQNIAVTLRTLPLILGRLRDVKETVRKAAYIALSRLKPRKFTIFQRQTVLKAGFLDRTDTVQNYIKDHFVPNWFAACDSNLLEFLSMLDVVSFESEILDKIISHLFSKIPSASLMSVIEELEATSNGKRVIEISKLTPESANLWASVVKFLGFDTCDGVILPELTYFAKYILSYSNEVDLKDMDHQFVLNQLLEIGKCYSFMDEMGRKQLSHTCIDILKNDKTEGHIIPSIVKLFELLVPIVKDRLILIAELISDIREPLESADGKIDDIDWEATDDKPKLEDNPVDSVEALSEGFSQLNCESASLGAYERAEKTDPDTLIKCLTIIEQTLKSPSVREVDATLYSLKEHFILKCFNSTNGKVLNLALDNLALLSYLSLDIAKESFIRFCYDITNDVLCESAVDAVFDVFLVHGFEPFSFGVEDPNTSINEIGEFLGSGGALDFNNDTTLNTVTRRIIPLLASLLKSNVIEIKYKVSLGLGKLLLSHINSSIVLAHLIILWFSPSTDNEPVIRQSLGRFFSFFSSRRLGAPEIILKAFSPTLRGIEELSEEIDLWKVASLLITLLSTEISSKVADNKTTKGSYHGQLALVILDELRQGYLPQHILAKALSQLTLSPKDEEISEELHVHALRTQKLLLKRRSEVERRTLVILGKFKKVVEELKQKFVNKKHDGDEKSTNEECFEEAKIEIEPSVISANVTSTQKRNWNEIEYDKEDSSSSSEKKTSQPSSVLGEELGIINESTECETDKGSEDMFISPPKRILRSRKKK